jgi:hypothetical protein
VPAGKLEECPITEIKFAKEDEVDYILNSRQKD